ncbi:MAG: DNA-directed RNA polymerase subunit beta' [Acidobacteriota bacterium]
MALRKATYLEKSQSINKIQAIQLKLASPDDILSWSHGEVLKPETINYRTFKPERDGLFCAKIFGPISDYECLCGKFKRMKYRGITCDKCGVEVIPSKVRRERMGHITLACPVSHIWYLKGTPPRISTILGMKTKDVESVNYYEQWVVTDPKFTVVDVEEAKKYYTSKYPNDPPQERNKILRNIEECVWEYDKIPKREKDSVKLFELLMKMSDNTLVYNPDLEGEKVLRYKALLYDKTIEALKAVCGKESFEFNIGATAIQQLLAHYSQTCQCSSCQTSKGGHKTRMECQVNLLRSYLKTDANVQKKTNINKKLKIFESCLNADIKPEWMVLNVLPVIPPELRPLVPLDGGRFATSDLNDLYRRVINRNNRLKRLQEMKAPEVIVRNEKRMLQEAVDALFDNGRRGRLIRGSNNRPLKSLSDTLKGKQGRFRQNLLGKRVDYSGRSVIVVGPELKLHQCGLPKIMALELFKPFICNKLQERGMVQTFKEAKGMVDRGEPEVYDVLDEVIANHPVLLNRAPTLHRLGIQTFEPVLVEGKAIKLHPLVCTAFNADFDGDQMAVHVPLSPASQAEASILMLSTNNLLYPANGTPIIVPTQDMVLGIYYLTMLLKGQKGEGRVFSGLDETLMAWQNGYLSLHAKIKIRYSGKYINLDEEPNLLEASVYDCKNELIEVTAGRMIFNSAMPKGFPFINGLIKKKQIKDIFTYAFQNLGREPLVKMADEVKSLGFRFATEAGISFGMDDMEVPKEKRELVAAAIKEVEEVEQQYREGAITNRERKNKVVDIWNEVTDKVADAMFKQMKEKQESASGTFNPIFIMADSGARGSKQQIRQLAGMRGLMAKPSGEIIEQPITANFREGLTVLQYFNSSHGARKGLADTALKTADAGYLTRRLVDVAQDVIITEEDCHTLDGIYISPLTEGGRIIEPLRNRIVGRVALDDIRDPYTKEIVVKANELITEDLARKVEDTGIEKVKIRSVLTCETRRGVCAKCYGRNLSSNRMVELGEAIGIMAAQSIGEPGTQLTMRTFHIGGTASKEAVETQHTARNSGKVKLVNVKFIEDQSEKKSKKSHDLIAMNRGGSIVIEDEQGREREKYPVVYGAHIKVKDGQKVNKGDILVEWDPYTNPILTDVGGTIEFKEVIDGVTVSEQTDPVTGLRQRVAIEPKDSNKEARIVVREEGKKSHFRSFSLPSGAHIMVEEGQEVLPGTILAKIPRETSKTKDIVGGLPRVVELFEARHPKNPAVVTEIDGEVHYDKKSSAQRKIVIDNPRSGEKREYTIPKGVHITVLEGEWVSAGDQLCEGSADPHEILKVLGIKDLQRFLVREIQEVYSLQGVAINDKHIEVIVRQMMRWMKVEEVGDTRFLIGEQVDRFEFQKENERVMSEGGQPAVGKPLLLGITKAALATDSWISAASFQETTRVLTEASLKGATDYLRGLKENVILGRLIPAGTGFYKYQDVELEHDETIQEETVDATDYFSISYVDSGDFLSKDYATKDLREIDEEKVDITTEDTESTE